MRILILLSLCVPAFASELPFSDPAKVGMSEDALAKVGPTVEKLIADNKLAGANVLILKKGKVVYEESFGMRDLARKKPMEKDTLFRIYSMTKALTSAAALMLCEEGKLSLDDPVGAYLPELAAPVVFVTKGKTSPMDRQPTVRDLMRHTGGFANLRGLHPVSALYRKGLPSQDKRTLDHLVGNIGKSPLLYQPGTKWVYGASSDLLAAVVAKAAGRPFEEVITERLINPLGMQDTGYSVPKEKADRLSVLYRKKWINGLGVLDGTLESRILEDPTFKGGGSGLISTARDYGRFLQMIANGGEFAGKRYLRKDTVDLMRTNQLPRDITEISFGAQKRHGTGFGLGFSVKISADKRWDKDALVGEYGWGGAASTHYWICPQHDLVVITMEQTMPYNGNLELALKPLIYNAVLK
ncbi:MAG: serine hydrolase domain-containing protein [Akkermansiaceae bacterium]